MLKSHLIGFLTGSAVLGWLGLACLGLALERLRPVERRQPARAVGLNLGYAVVHSWAIYVLGPLAATASVALVNALGGGFVELPADGWGLLWAIPAYLLAMDLAEYLFHRAQHAWAPLWAMHSLHHSETALNITTTLRHFWIEAAIKTVCVYPCVGLLVKPSPLVLTVYFAAGYWNFVAHMNSRVSFGRLWAVLNSPQYHRIHHAADPGYANRNFAGLFPVFDLLFGTCRRPQRDEYPPVGLAGGEAPSGLFDAVIWPLRHHVRNAAAPRRALR